LCASAAAPQQRGVRAAVYIPLAAAPPILQINWSSCAQKPPIYGFSATHPLLRYIYIYICHLASRVLLFENTALLIPPPNPTRRCTTVAAAVGEVWLLQGRTT